MPDVAPSVFPAQPKRLVQRKDCQKGGLLPLLAVLVNDPLGILRPDTQVSIESFILSLLPLLLTALHEIVSILDRKIAIAPAHVGDDAGLIGLGDLPIQLGSDHGAQLGQESSLLIKLLGWDVVLLGEVFDSSSIPVLLDDLEVADDLGDGGEGLDATVVEAGGSGHGVCFSEGVQEYPMEIEGSSSGQCPAR